MQGIDKSCGSCTYSVPTPQDPRRKLFCLRFPPQIIALSETKGKEFTTNGPHSFFPVVDWGTWCGEFKVRT